MTSIDRSPESKPRSRYSVLMYVIHVPSHLFSSTNRNLADKRRSACCAGATRDKINLPRFRPVLCIRVIDGDHASPKARSDGANSIQIAKPSKISRKRPRTKKAPPSEAGPRRVDQRQSRAELSAAAFIGAGPRPSRQIRYNGQATVRVRSGIMHSDWFPI